MRPSPMSPCYYKDYPATKKVECVLSSVGYKHKEQKKTFYQ